MKRRLAHAAASFALFGTAWAQPGATNVTVYGVVDVAIAREWGGPSGTTKLDGSGVHSGSRWGLRGSEDLGGGLSALFTLESGFNSDDGSVAQGGLMFGRQAFVGVRGGFGSLTAGRQYTPHEDAIDAFDPLDGISGGADNLLRRTVRIDNALVYASPNWDGLSARLAYGLGEVAGSNSAGRVLGAAWAARLARWRCGSLTTAPATAPAAGTPRTPAATLSWAAATTSAWRR